MPMQYTVIFNDVKMKIFSGFVYVFLIFAQNIDCGYTLEPPAYPSLTIYKWGSRWYTYIFHGHVFLIKWLTCNADETVVP